MWLDYVQPIIYRSYDHDIIIVFSLKRDFIKRVGIGMSVVC